MAENSVAIQPIGRNCDMLNYGRIMGHTWCWYWGCCIVDTHTHVIFFTKEDQGDVYYYLHKKLDDNYDVISALERQLMVETADREKAETEYARQIEELEIRKDDELGPLKQKLRAEEEQVIPHGKLYIHRLTMLCVLGFLYFV